MEEKEHLTALEKIDLILQHCLDIESKNMTSGLMFYLDDRDIVETENIHNACPQDLTISNSSESTFLFKLMRQMDLILYESSRKYEKSVKLAENNGQTTSNIRLFQIGIEAYKHAHKQAFTVSNEFFVAMPFNDKMRELWKSVIEGIEEKTDFKSNDLLVSSSADHNNDITLEIMARIKKSKFVIADLTDKKPNVYWEAGFAKGLGKKVILCVQKHSNGELKNNIDFDLRQILYIDYENETDLAEKLIKRIEATID